MMISIRIHRNQLKAPVKYDTHELSWWCEDIDAGMQKTLSTRIQNSAWFKRTRFEPGSTGRPVVPQGNGFLSMRAKFTEEREIREIESEVSSLLQQLGVNSRQHLPLKCKHCTRAIGGFGLPSACLYCGASIKADDSAANFLAASFHLPNLEELIAHGEITITEIQPVGCVAVASDQHNTLAMLQRRKDESLLQLMARLDQAVAKAKKEGVVTDEINRPVPGKRTSFNLEPKEEIQGHEEEAAG
jgi:hypothetical protein